MDILVMMKVGFALVVGCLVEFLGGYDMLLTSLVTLVVIDYVTGVLKALYDGSASSQIGFKGIIKKVMIFLIVAVAVVAENLIGGESPIREITVVFWCGNEGISILENASMLPIPEKLRLIFEQLTSKGSD